MSVDAGASAGPLHALPQQNLRLPVSTYSIGRSCNQSNGVFLTCWYASMWLRARYAEVDYVLEIARLKVRLLLLCLSYPCFPNFVAWCRSHQAPDVSICVSVRVCAAAAASPCHCPRW